MSLVSLWQNWLMHQSFAMLEADLYFVYKLFTLALSFSYKNSIEVVPKHRLNVMSVLHIIHLNKT